MRMIARDPDAFPLLILIVKRGSELMVSDIVKGELPLSISLDCDLFSSFRVS